MDSYFLHSLKKISSLNELEQYFDSEGMVRMPPNFVKQIINNPLLYIYHKFFLIRKAPENRSINHNLAESIFNIAQVEYLKDKKNKQAKKIALKAAEFCIKSMKKDGSYDHDEFDHEDQFPLHAVAINTLINAYNLFGDKKYLDSAIKGTNFLLDSRFEDVVEGKTLFWFPHDTLELSSGNNRFISNSHMYTVAVLCMMHTYVKKSTYLSAAKKGVEYFNYLLKKYPESKKFNSFNRYLIRKPSIFGFLPTPLSAIDFFRMSKTPSLRTASGFTKRALYEPGPHYHFANLLNMELVNQYIPLEHSLLSKAWDYAAYLLRNGFKNKLYIHSDWYAQCALMLAIRRDLSFKKYTPLLNFSVGVDPRIYQTLEPSTQILKQKKPVHFFNSLKN